MPNYSTIPCTELNGTRVESYDFTGKGSSSIQLKCLSSNTISLIADILNNRRVDPLVLGLYAHSASVAQVGGESGGYTESGQAIIPDYQVVTIQYQSIDPDDPDQNPDPENPSQEEFVTETLEPAVEFMTGDHKNLQWDAPNIDDSIRNITAEEAPGKLMFQCKLVRNWRKVPSLPIEIVTLLGKTNEEPYFSPKLNLTFGAETLLYQGTGMSRTMTRAKANAWNLTQNFLIKPTGHNKFYVARLAHTDEGPYFKMKNKEDGSIVNPYPPENLTPILGGI